MTFTKSFSEQHKYPSNRSHHLQRSKSHSVAQQASRPQRPLPPVSEVTKSKLQKFQFRPPRPESDAADAFEAQQQNIPTGPRTSAVPRAVNVITVEDESDKENRAISGPQKTSPVAAAVPDHLKANVSTPLARLAWQDLMGLSGDTPKEEEDKSPSERLLWHNDGRSSFAAISPMLARRGKKRARSSSPNSSSPSNPKLDTPAVDVNQLKQALRSPYADPAMELWDRFSLSGTSNATPSGIANPALAHLMASSSPRPAKDGAVTYGEGSLRRAISCGNWPKRRRIEKADGASPSNRFRQGRATTSKNSMVSALLETVTDEITKSDALQARHEALRSPSPTKRTARGHDAGSPLRRRAPPPARPQEGTVSVGMGSGAQPGPRSQDSTSEYGDDDFDEDMIMELDASLLPSAEPGSASLEDRQDEACQPIAGPIAEQESTGGVEDEFGDLDDDVFAEAEDLIAEIDSKQPSQLGGGGQSRNGLDDDPGGGQEEADDLYGDDFGGDFDFEAAELAATQSVQPAQVSASLANSSLKPAAIQRYLVTSVHVTSYTDGDSGRDISEKILIVKAERTNADKTVHLRGDWIETHVSHKAYVHIIGAFEPANKCIIDNTQNMLILHPDQLISATVIADSFSCLRRAVLQDRIKETSGKTPALVYGTLLHEIFQEAMIDNHWDTSFLASTIDKIMQKHMEDLYTIGVPINEAREHLLSKTKDMQYWAKAFVSPYPRPDATVQGRNGDKVQMCISKLLDVEEHVWSPMYGLKGNIDATVQVTMKTGQDRQTLTVPLELKTGRTQTKNHQAQTVLYNLLLSERYDVEIVYGILYYTELSQTLRIPTIRHELRHMIMQRNLLASYIRERSVQLPPMKKDKSACGRCFAQTSCFVYHKLADDGDGETSGMKDKFDDVVKHLTPTHKDFFLKWEDLLTKEETESRKLRRELWTMLSSEREKVGRCFGNVVIEEGSASEDRNSPKINRFHYTFIKPNSPAAFSFLDSQLSVGEAIVVSDEAGHFALALGYVTSVRKQRIGVAVDRRLHNARIRQAGFDETTNQVFASIMEVAPEGATVEESQGRIREPPVRYRLDKDEYSNGMALVRNNLVAVMTDTPLCRDVRRLVVDLAPPSFKTVSTQYTIADDQDSLNVDQKRAIEKVMSAKDYALVLGMPGTGKTTTIAHIIRALVRQKKTVLLASHTHSAVDNILLKLKGDGTAVLRVGAPAKIHPGVRDFAILAGQPKDTFEEIDDAWNKTPIVATTCLKVDHPCFSNRTFDYCIVDEASQITLPICLGPIRLARTFVLVGDHNQLPPLVKNEAARSGGLDVSLFKLLSDAHPASVVNLEHQYRMCEDIMTLSNTLIYQGRLKCGTESLRHRALDVPHLGALSRHHHHDVASFLLRASQQQQHGAVAAAAIPSSFCTGSPCWLRDLVDPATRVAFVNTDAVPGSREEAKGNRTVNVCEARIVTQLVAAMLTAGVAAAEIGVVTHYRSQLALLRNQLHSLPSSSSSAVEAHTADSFQGRDKDVVVLSLVRSNESCNIGDLLRDWRRINVAFTRARTKLLVVGSRDTLRRCGDAEMLARFVQLMEARDWVYDLPPDALDSHVFDDLATQRTDCYNSSSGGLGLGLMRSPPGTRKTAASPRKVLSPKVGMSSPKKGGGLRVIGGGKENAGIAGPRRAKIGVDTLLKGKPISRNIWQEVMGDYMS